MSSKQFLVFALTRAAAAGIGFVLMSPVSALGGSLHEQPVGTKVVKTFELGPKRIYAPEADWVLGARHAWQGTRGGLPGGPWFGGVVLLEIQDGRLARSIAATGNVQPSDSGWAADVDPCKRPQTALTYRDLSKNSDNQFCFDISELRRSTPVPDWVLPSRQWLAEHNVELAPSRLMVRYATLDKFHWYEVRYSFDPSGFGGQTWEQKVQEATRWAEENAAAVRAGLLTKSTPAR